MEESTFRFSRDQWGAMEQLSELAVEWGRFVEQEASARDPEVFANVNAVPLFDPKQLWPIFVGPTMARELERSTKAVFDAVRRSVRREVAAGRAEGLGRFHGPEVNVDACLRFLEQTDDAALAASRADVFATEGGFRFVELNVAGVLGGWESAISGDVIASMPPVAAFARDRGLSLAADDPFSEMLRNAVLVHVERHGSAEPFNFGIVGPTPYDDSPRALAFRGLVEHRFETCLREHAPDVSGSLLLAGLEELVVEGGAVTFGGTRIHALTEYIGPWPRSPKLDEVAQTMAEGAHQVFSGPVTTLLSDKRVFALVLEQCERGAVDADEARTLESLIPWTRVVEEGLTHYRGAECPMGDLLGRERERLVLKKGLSLGGKDVVIGAEAPPSEWEAAATAAFETGDWVVQELVEAQPYPVLLPEEGVVDRPIVWSQFLSSGQGGAVFGRVSPRPGPTKINSHMGAYDVIVFRADR